MRKVIYGITRDAGSVEDLINDTFVKSIRNISALNTLNCRKIVAYLVYTALRQLLYIYFVVVYFSVTKSSLALALRRSPALCYQGLVLVQSSGENVRFAQQ